MCCSLCYNWPNLIHGCASYTKDCSAGKYEIRKITVAAGQRFPGELQPNSDLPLVLYWWKCKGNSVLSPFPGLGVWSQQAAWLPAGTRYREATGPGGSCRQRHCWLGRWWGERWRQARHHWHTSSGCGVEAKALTSFNCWGFIYGVGLDSCIKIVYQRFLKFQLR